MTHTSNRWSNLALLLITLPAISACSSTQEKDPRLLDDPRLQDVEVTGGEATPYSRDPLKDNRRIGFILAEIDRKVGIWANLVLRGDPAKDTSTLTQVESSIRYEASKHASGLVEQLETGPPRNRKIAATALGFVESKKETASPLGPLLAALDDSDDEVIANALLGLSILADPKTPLTRIAGMLQDRERDAAARNNAGRVLRAMPTEVLRGSEKDAVLRAARFSVGDEDSRVRIHGLMILAQMEDSESLSDMASLLGDENRLVQLAASRAVAYVGEADSQSLGNAARALQAARRNSKSKGLRSAVLDDLRRLTQRNFDSEDEWLEYVNQLN